MIRAIVSVLFLALGISSFAEIRVTQKKTIDEKHAKSICHFQSEKSSRSGMIEETDRKFITNLDDCLKSMRVVLLRSHLLIGHKVKADAGSIYYQPENGSKKCKYSIEREQEVKDEFATQIRHAFDVSTQESLEVEYPKLKASLESIVQINCP